MTKALAAISAVCLAWSGTTLAAVSVRAATPAVETVPVLTPIVHGHELPEGAIDERTNASGNSYELARVATAVPVWPVRSSASGQAGAILRGLRSTAEVAERYTIGAVTLVPAATEIKPPARPSVYASAPHTAAGLKAWLATLRWPWGEIGTCESYRDGSWRESSTSWARGVFQFLPSTWRSLGLTGDPATYSWRFQLKAAERLRARDGLGAWTCAKLLGLAR
jgi:hypothetical protein